MKTVRKAVVLARHDREGRWWRARLWWPRAAAASSYELASRVVGQGPQWCCRLQCRQVGWTSLSIIEFQSYSSEAQAVPPWKRKQFMQMPETLGLRGSEK